MLGRRSELVWNAKLSRGVFVSRIGIGESIAACDDPCEDSCNGAYLDIKLQEAISLNLSFKSRSTRLQIGKKNGFLVGTCRLFPTNQGMTSLIIIIIILFRFLCLHVAASSFAFFNRR